MAEELLQALKERDFRRAERRFSPSMRDALPEAKLEADWATIVRALGELKSWRAIARDEPYGFARRRFELTLERGRLEARIVADSRGREVVGLFFVRSPPAESVEYETDTMRAVPLTLGGGADALNGTLTIPRTLNGQVPGVLLISGSGPNDRDETIGPNKPFKDLADGLSSRGIVVARYDKRTFAHPERFDVARGTVQEEVLIDAIAGLQQLRQLPMVDPDKIFIVGHSLGALLAAEVATKAGPVAGLVLIAPPGRPLPVLVLAQLQYLGKPEHDLADLRDRVARLLARQLRPEETLFGVPVSYWYDLSNRDEIGLASALGRPILIVRGSRDYQVTEPDIDVWRTRLSGAQSVQIETLNGLNHFLFEGQGPSAPIEYVRPAHMAPTAIAKIAGFILRDFQ